jgi:RNA polymerase sigma factor for flagellar operon FliA
MSKKNVDMTQEWNKLFQSSYEDKEALDKLVLNYVWLIKYVIQQMHLPGNSFLAEDDFLNFGILGLYESIKRFDPERGVKFESYAIPRIRGIIQDELRKLDWLSRTARKKATEYINASDQLRTEKGSDISPDEIMKKLQVTPEQYHSYLAAAAAAKASLSMNESFSMPLNIDDNDVNLMEEIPDNDQISTLDAITNEEKLDHLVLHLQNLPEKKRLVITLYYYEELTFKEIGKLIDVSESRVCQIHSQVMKDLRKKMKEFQNA